MNIKTTIYALIGPQVKETLSQIGSAASRARARTAPANQSAPRTAFLPPGFTGDHIPASVGKRPPPAEGPAPFARHREPSPNTVPEAERSLRQPGSANHSQEPAAPEAKSLWQRRQLCAALFQLPIALPKIHPHSEAGPPMTPADVSVPTRRSPAGQTGSCRTAFLHSPTPHVSLT